MVKQTQEKSSVRFFNLNRSSLDMFLTSEFGEQDNESFFTEKENVMIMEL